MKKFFKNKIFQNGYMLLLALLGLVSISLAWFVTTKLGNIDTLSFAAEKVPIVKISVDGTSYDDDIDIDLSETLSPITGNGLKDSNGNVNLWNPTISVTNNVGYDSQQWASTDDYYEFNLYFDATNVTDIYLSPESTVTPLDTTARTSNFGDFSADYIAGAVRVGIYRVTTVNNVETETLQVVWVPNPNYELTTNSDNSKTFNANGAAESAYSYFDGTNVVTAGSTFTSVLPCKVEELVDDGTQRTLHYRIRIWVEGTDREADTALSGGKFSVNLDFESKYE